MGVQLDGIGQIVGVSRPSGYSDITYYWLLKVKILTNNTTCNGDNYLDMLAFLFSSQVLYRLRINLYPVYWIQGIITDPILNAMELIPSTLGLKNTFISIGTPSETFTFSSTATSGEIGLGFGTTTDPDKGGRFAYIIE